MTRREKNGCPKRRGRGRAPSPAGDRVEVTVAEEGRVNDGDVSRGHSTFVARTRPAPSRRCRNVAASISLSRGMTGSHVVSSNLEGSAVEEFATIVLTPTAAKSLVWFTISLGAIDSATSISVLTSISSRSRPTSSQWRPSTASSRTLVSASPKILRASAATRRRVLCSPLAPLKIRGRGEFTGAGDHSVSAQWSCVPS